MLTDAQRTIVKATVPLLETGGEALTTHFYRTMLSEYAEVRPLFNQAHQASGAQPRALANAVLMYARNIDHLDRLGALPAQIIAKHVALQVLPEHYPIVGTCLLRAIREVLGEQIATDAVIDAWAAAYQQLADILIAAEASVYDATANTPGGWRGERSFRVAEKIRESAEIVSFVLVPQDNGPVIAHEPGQYLGLRLNIDGTEHRRNYSLSAPTNGRSLRISVKREAAGAVSTHLHDQLAVGDNLAVFPPAGTFTLAAGDKPVVFISGGVGITPTLPMLDAALAAGRPVRFIHCARHPQVHAFRAWIDGRAEQSPALQRFYCYDDAAGEDNGEDVVQGRLDAQRLAAWLPEDRDVDVYFLGPAPFMAGVRRDLAALGVPQAQARYEFFGPAQALA